MAINRSTRAEASPASAAPARTGSAVARSAGREREQLPASLSSVRLAIGLVDLSTMTVRAVSDAACDELGLRADQIVGRPVAEVIDPRDRQAAATALEAMRSGAIEFYRAHRHGAGPAKPKSGLCAWVRRIDLDGRPHAFVRFEDPRVPPGPWPSAADVFAKGVAIAITDARGIVRTASLCPVIDDEFSIDDIRGTRLVPSPAVDNLVTLRDHSGETVELEAIATALAEPAGWMVVLLRMDPPSTSHEAQLEGHLWRIAAELEASGILMHAGATPGLALARIPEAAGLSPRQWEVLRRIVAGQRVPTIASELFVSPSTVRNHLSAIFERFGVHSQAELLARLSPTDDPSI